MEQAKAGGIILLQVDIASVHRNHSFHKVAMRETSNAELGRRNLPMMM
jgi:hypothetical protein